MTPHESSSEGGVSVVELILYVLVVSLFLSLTVMIFVNSLRTQDEVVSQTQATSRSQLVAATLERSLRNAIAFDISADGSTLLVKTSLENDLVCQGFSLSSAGARFTQTETALPSASTWPLWQEGVVPHASAPFFAPSLSGVDYDFDIDTDSATVRVSGSITPRNLTGVTAPCW